MRPQNGKEDNERIKAVINPKEKRYKLKANLKRKQVNKPEANQILRVSVTLRNKKGSVNLTGKSGSS